MDLFKKFFKGNTLYYPGCLTKFVLEDIQENYKRLLEKEGIEFIMLKEKEFCCGSPIKNAGAAKEFEEIAAKNLKVFKEHGVDRIISNCPSCTAVFKIDYKNVLGEKWNIEVFHITEILSPKPQKSKDTSEKIVTYHDSCHLGRTMGVYDQPRKLLEKAGCRLAEMKLCREKSFCCGGGGGVKSNNPELANLIAGDRVSQAKETGAEILATACPMCYANLKENSKNITVKELSEILGETQK